jgi:hypothetical protein
MKKIGLLLGFILTMSVTMTNAQNHKAVFESNESVWNVTGSSASSEFTLNMNMNELKEITEKLDNTGSTLSYAVESSDENTHKIILTYADGVSKPYLYKMLLYIGCDSVNVAGEDISLDAFMQLLID